jgi:hypothetical protein
MTGTPLSALFPYADLPLPGPGWSLIGHRISGDPVRADADLAAALATVAPGLLHLERQGYDRIVLALVVERAYPVLARHTTPADTQARPAIVQSFAVDFYEPLTADQFAGQLAHLTGAQRDALYPDGIGTGAFAVLRRAVGAVPTLLAALVAVPPVGAPREAWRDYAALMSGSEVGMVVDGR